MSLPDESRRVLLATAMVLLNVLGCQRPVPFYCECRYSYTTKQLLVTPIMCDSCALLYSDDYEVFCEGGQMFFANITNGQQLEAVDAIKLAPEADWTRCDDWM